MDPNEALSRIRDRLDIVEAWEEGENDVTEDDAKEAAIEACDLLRGLDAWLVSGGCFPQSWTRR